MKKGILDVKIMKLRHHGALPNAGVICGGNNEVLLYHVG